MPNPDEILTIDPHNATQIEEYEGKFIYTYSLDSRFRIIGKDTSKEYPAIKTELDSPSISLYRLVGGFNNLEAFKQEGAEFTDDALDILSTPENVLRLPFNYSRATNIILSQYKGKVLRIIARSPLGNARFGDRLYLFSVE